MKLRNRIITSLFLINCFLFSSCTKMLTVEPTSVITTSSFWKTKDDVDGALAGMYVKLRNEATLNLYLLGESRSETLGWGQLVGDTYNRYHQNNLDENNAGPSWLGWYATINSANLILKYVPDISYTNENEKKLALAQAYSMRAYAYFVIARTWGEAIIRTEPTEGYDINEAFKPRESIEEVFKLIKDDLDKAIALYPSNNIASTRAEWSKASSNALKADVYLWTAKKLDGGKPDFTIALQACEDIEGSNVDLLDNYESIFSYDNKGSIEILMAVRFNTIESADNYFYNMYIPTYTVPTNTDQNTLETIGVPGGNIILSPSAALRAQFVDDDTRKDASYLEIYTETSGVKSYFGSIVIKGNGVVEGGVRKFADDVILYRYADVLLMKAEAKNALSLDPSNEINMVRKRAYKDKYSDYKFVKGSIDYNDEEILKERLLELAFEGKRWWDLVRFNKAFDLVPSLNGRADKKHLELFPIGSNVLSLEPEVVQNAGY